MSSALTTVDVSPPAAEPRVRTLHYVFSTHWDREWYQPFQHYRMRLVQLIDEVIDGMEDGSFLGPFQMDGQTILVDDYLEVRPDRRPTIERLVNEGRLLIGPWYVLPDEFLVSGESMVRNLRRGRAAVRQYGATPSCAGFVCDLFGHVSQLPQILAGFGIEAVYLWRGVNPRDTRQLIWTGADGTRLPAYHFGRRGYCDYASTIRSAFKYDVLANDDSLAESLGKWLERELDLSVIPDLLAFDGGDHQHWDHDNYRRVRELLEDRADVRWKHSSLEEFTRALVEHSDKITEEVSGELRESGLEPMHVDEQWVIPGVASSRVWIKQANARCQNLLTRWAEPFAALDQLVNGTPSPDGHLRVAWDWLLKNHPHDSIGGCSVDRVHQDMRFRFSQCEQIAEKLADEAVTRITLASGRPEENTVKVGVANPDPRPRDGVVALTIEIPSDWPTYNEFFGYEAKPAFRLCDDRDDEVAYQMLALRPGRRRLRLTPYSFPEVRTVTEVDVAVELRLPATGVGQLRIEPGKAHQPTRHPQTPSLVTADDTLENEHLRVTVTTGGQLHITDKRSGRTYDRLLRFEDAADIGDGWYHGQCVSDDVVNSARASADISVIARGPKLSQFRIRTRMSVPESFDRSASRRSDQRIELVFDSLVTLRKGEASVDVHTDVENTSRDHRVRVLFDSGCRNARTAHFDSAFDVVERSIAMQPDNHLYRELEIETRPQQSFTYVSDEQGGLAIMAAGLHEAAVIDQPTRAIALTLYRSTDTTVMTNGEPDGQLLGPLAFDYRIVPTLPGTCVGKLASQAASFTAGLRTVHLHPEDYAEPEKAYLRVDPKDDAAGASLISIQGDAVLSALLPRPRGVEVRLFNPSEQTITAALASAVLSLDGAAVTDLNLDGEGVVKSFSCEGDTLSIELRPKQIRSLAIDRASEDS